MADDPFAPQVAYKALEISLSLKPSGSYDASLINVKGSPRDLAALLKIEVGPDASDFDVLWKVSLRWNDLARAVQSDEAKKQASAGKA